MRLAWRKNPRAHTAPLRDYRHVQMLQIHCRMMRTGNRRFVVIRLKGGDVRHAVQYLESNRMQLWAEAVELYRRDVEAWLPQELASVQSVSNEAARRCDEILEDAVEGALLHAAPTFTLAWLAAQVTLLRPGSSAVQLSAQEVRRLGAALTTRGYVRRSERQNGKKVKIWKVA